VILAASLAVLVAVVTFFLAQSHHFC